ncbi:MAG: hypothetical protein M1825_006301 [Sarcosagium campestre]|nr:MAG: hypothetical protein M1825_006301 [Sarcosagium campestre]
MQELLLYASVSASRHDQLLDVLAGIAGMLPQRVLERHLVYKPSRTSTFRANTVGGSQGIQSHQGQALQGQTQGDLFYLHLSGQLDERTFPQESSAQKEPTSAGDIENVGHDPAKTYKFGKQAWSLRYNDWPEATGRRPVTSRTAIDVDIIEGDAVNFIEAFGYSFVNEYIVDGYRLVYENVIILLHRILRFPSPPESEQGERISTENENLTATGPREHLSPLSTLEPLDPSGAYLLQSSICVLDGSKPESMTVGINELKRFKEMMKGVVDLEIGDRLALDTRLK